MYPESESSATNEDGECYGINKPFMLAASFCAVEIFQRLILFLSKSELISSGSNSNNVIHVLILALTENGAYGLMMH